MEENIRAAKVVIFNEREWFFFPCFVFCCDVENDLNKTVWWVNLLRVPTFALHVLAMSAHKHARDPPYVCA